jgi:DNA-binding Lrp family transcriptional regulator
LFNVGAGSEDQVLKDAKNIGGVQEAYVSYGVYDLVMKVKADSMEKLKELVTHQLRTIKNVRSTLTLILTEE